MTHPDVHHRIREIVSDNWITLSFPNPRMAKLPRFPNPWALRSAHIKATWHQRCGETRSATQILIRAHDIALMINAGCLSNVAPGNPERVFAFIIERHDSKPCCNMVRRATSGACQLESSRETQDEAVQRYVFPRMPNPCFKQGSYGAKLCAATGTTKKSRSATPAAPEVPGIR